MTTRKGNEVFSGENTVPEGLQQHMDAIAAMNGGSLPKTVTPVQGMGVRNESITTMLARDFGIEIPNEVVPLPSRGIAYPTEHPLYGKDTVDITAMTAKEEDILTSQALLKKGTVVTELIRSCLCDKSIDPLDLLVGDRNALMVAIRVTGYGASYDGEITCDECKEKSQRSFDLSQLVIRQLALKPVNPGTNEFATTLSKFNVPITFKFLTGRDEEEISLVAAKQKKLLQGMSKDSTISTFLQYSIMSINGVYDRAKIAAFAKQCPAQVSSDLRKFINDNAPGIVMKQESICPLCNHVEEVNIPIGVNFLWPNAG